MTQTFLADGTVVPVTVIEAGPCVVTQVRTEERDGYVAVQLGFGEAKNLNKPERGHLKRLGLFKHLREFRVDGDLPALGDKIDVGIFAENERVDVVGTSKGKGFAGVVKRHHFRGGPKTHGQSDRHRAPGSIGATTTPGRVLKGTKMAGQMGNKRRTQKGLQVIQTDLERNLLLVKGAVPGARNGLLIIKKAIRAGK
jgi:large subunit ribosomal protein L3